MRAIEVGPKPNVFFARLVFLAFVLSPAVPTHAQTAALASATPIDPRTALIVIDLQNSILSRSTVDPVDRIIERASHLIDTFHWRALPVVLVNAIAQPPGRIDQPHRSEGPPVSNRSALVAQLPRQPGDHLVSKRSWSAFSRTDLTDYLRSRGITQIVIVGYTASGAVESTAREGYDLGFNVTLVRDAITDTNAEALTNAMTRVFPRLGHLATTEDVVGQLTATQH